KRLQAAALYRVGRAEFDRGNTKAAKEEFLLSQRAFEEEKSPGDLVYVLADLGALFVYESDYEEGEEYSRKVLELSEAPSANGHSEHAPAQPYRYGAAMAWSNLGHVARWKGDHPAAIDCFNRSLAVWKELRQRGYWSSANITDALIDIAHVYQDMG